MASTERHDPGAVTVRELPAEATEERAAVERVGKAAFPTLQAQLLELTPHVLAATREGEVVGGTISEVLEPAPDRRVGLVTWIFTAEEARGLHVGERLLEATLEYLEGLDCEAVLAVVEWRNTSSSKLFASRGFERTSVGDLADEYGVGGAATLWWESMYWPAPGYDLWSRGVREDEEEAGSVGRSAGRLLEAFGANAALFAVATASLFGVGVLRESPWAVLGVPLAFLAVRHLPARLATLGDDDRWRFWSWGNVYAVPAALAALGLFVPAPGNLAPVRRVWTYREELPRLGPAAAVAGALTVGLYAAALFEASLPVVSLPDAVATLVVYGAWAFLLVDLVWVTWPFDTYNGRVVYDWNRAVWAALAGAALVLLAVAALRALPVG